MTVPTSDPAIDKTKSKPISKMKIFLIYSQILSFIVIAVIIASAFIIGPLTSRSDYKSIHDDLKSDSSIPIAIGGFGLVIAIIFSQSQTSSHSRPMPFPMIIGFSFFGTTVYLWMVLNYYIDNLQSQYDWGAISIMLILPILGFIIISILLHYERHR